MTPEARDAAARMLEAWAVKPTEERHWSREVSERVAFLQQVLRKAGRCRLVLGVSGGVDSLVAGKLCQLAVDGMKEEAPDAEFIAVRLPYGAQLDEDDAQAALAFIAPDRVWTVNIRPSVDALHTAVVGGRQDINHAKADFERGNVKARIRMTVQYEIAALHDGLVVGTDHNAEAITGFYTKWGDGACDLLPLRGLNKRQVRLLAEELGASHELAYKPATADLEDLRPLRSDEEALGIPYQAIDDFLERRPIDDAYLESLVRQYVGTEHKRVDPPAAQGNETCD
jgi:NAD+ synthase